jgi:hypothetical protein
MNDSISYSVECRVSIFGCPKGNLEEATIRRLDTSILISLDFTSLGVCAYTLGKAYIRNVDDTNYVARES